MSRYRVLGRIGQGGMGEVFLAEDRELERRVALKFLAPALREDAAAMARLKREAKAAAALDHPYVCKVYDMGEAEGRAFISMEFVDGETLGARLEKGPLPTREALRLAVEITEALERAHAGGIVHRDLKPSNVMLGRDGHVKVMDFGIAKVIRADVSSESEGETREGAPTRGGSLVGTPGYMSPEQLRGDTVDERSDLFAFGVVLQEMLTGAHPFRRDSGAETVAAILKEAPTGGEGLAFPLRSLVEKLVSKAADQRPRITEARAELQRLLERPELLEAERPARRVFVGRESETVELRRLTGRLASREGGLLLIGGEPGVGKTRLCRETLKAAEEMGFLPLEGHCHETESAQPFTPWVDSLELASRLLPSDGFREVLGEAAPEIAKLMPGLRRTYRDIPEPIPLPAEQQRRYLFNSFQEFVIRLSDRAPVVWLLDDLHWADESSLLLLLHLAPHLANVPVLFLGTYRDVELEVGKPFERVLAQLVRQRLAQRISLRRLREAEVAELLSRLGGAEAPDTLVRLVFQETEGNPFFVEEVFAHLSEEGKLFDETGAWKSELDVAALEVPEGVKLVIGRRLERLSESTPKVLAAAAIIGRVFDVRLLEVLKGFDADEVLEAVEEAETAGLVFPSATRRESTYTFSHELVRNTLLGTLSLPRLQRLHLHVAEALEKKDSDAVGEIAQHLYQAGAAVELPKTIHYLGAAGERALEANAPEEARYCFDTALSLDVEDRTTEAKLLLGRGEAFRRLVLPDKAVQDWYLALPAYEEAKDGATVARICCDMSALLYWAGRVEESLEVARRGLRVENHRDSDRCRLLAAEGTARSLTGSYSEAKSRFDEALQIAEKLDDPRLRAEILRYQAAGCYVFVRLGEGYTAGTEAMRLLRPTVDLWGLADAQGWTLAVLFMMGKMDEASRVLEELEVVARRVGNLGGLWALSIRLHLAILQGELERLEALARDTVRTCLEIGIPWGVSETYGMLALSSLWQGNYDDALGSAQRSVEAEVAAFPMNARPSLMLIHAYMGRRDLALEQLSQIELPSPDRVNDVGKVSALPMVVEALAVLEERDALEELYPLTQESPPGMAQSLFGGLTPQTVAGIAAAAAGRFEAAARHFASALEGARVLQHRLALPQIGYWHAKMLMERDEPGDRAEALRMLEEVAAEFRALGMPRHLEMALELSHRR